MHDDESYWRFFGWLNLFTFAMLMLVLGDNLLLMFVGWEGVGLCSFALIGFWYKVWPTPAPATRPSSSTASATWPLSSRSSRCSGPWRSRASDAGHSRNRAVAHAAGRQAGYFGVALVTVRHAAALRRRHRQVGADSALRLAARRDGRPDAGQRADPRRDDGHRRRLHDRAA